MTNHNWRLVARALACNTQPPALVAIVIIIIAVVIVSLGWYGCEKRRDAERRIAFVEGIVTLRAFAQVAAKEGLPCPSSWNDIAIALGYEGATDARIAFTTERMRVSWELFCAELDRCKADPSRKPDIQADMLYQAY